MSYIPDTRDPIEKSPFSKKETANPYYEGILDEESAWAVKHYDFGVADCINALDNADAAYDIAAEMMDDEIPEGSEELFTEEQMEFLMDEKTIRFLKNTIICWAEMQRDDMVIAKIENMKDEIKVPREKQLEEDFNSLSREEFLNKYKRREYNEYGSYDNEYVPHEALVVPSEKAAQERFKLEYARLSEKCKKLKNMLDNWDHLRFNPTCPKTLLEAQLKAMNEYLGILDERAKLEKIDLNNLEEYTW